MCAYYIKKGLKRVYMVVSRISFDSNTFNRPVKKIVCFSINIGMFYLILVLG